MKRNDSLTRHVADLAVAPVVVCCFLSMGADNPAWEAKPGNHSCYPWSFGQLKA